MVLKDIGCTAILPVLQGLGVAYGF